MATIELSSEDEDDCMILDSGEQEDVQPSHFVCLKENELNDFLLNEDTSENNEYQSESQSCNPEFKGDPGGDVLETKSDLLSDIGLKEEISENCDLDGYKNNHETGAYNISKQDNNAIFQRLAEALSTVISSSLHRGVNRFINKNDDKTDSITKENRNVDVVGLNSNNINITNELLDNTNNSSKRCNEVKSTHILEEKSLVTVKKRGRKPGWRKTLVPNPSIKDTSLDSSMPKQKKRGRKPGWKKTPTLSSTGQERLQEMPTPKKKKRGRKPGWRKYPETNSTKPRCSKSIMKCDQKKIMSSSIGKPQVLSNKTTIGIKSEGETNSKTNVNSDDLNVTNSKNNYIKPQNKINLVSKSTKQCDIKIKNVNKMSRISQNRDFEQAIPNMSSDLSNRDSSFTPQNSSLSHNELEKIKLTFQKSNTYIKGSREPTSNELPESSPSKRVRSSLTSKNEFSGPNPPLSVQTRPLSDNEFPGTHLSNPPLSVQTRPLSDNEFPGTHPSNPPLSVQTRPLCDNEFPGTHPSNPPLSVQTRPLSDNEFPGTHASISILQSRLSGGNNFPINCNPLLSMTPTLTGQNKLPGYAVNLQSELVGENMLPGPNPCQNLPCSRFIGDNIFPEHNPAPNVQSRPTGDSKFLGTNPDLNLLRSKQRCDYEFPGQKPLSSRLTGMVKQDEPVLKEDFLRCYNKIFDRTTEYSSIRLGDILLLTLKEVKNLTYRMNDAKKLTCELLQAKEIKIIEDSFKSIFDEYTSSFCSVFHETFFHILSYEEEVYQHKALILALFMKMFLRITTSSPEFLDSLILAKHTVKSMLKQYLLSLPTLPSAILRGTFWVSDTDFERNCWFILDFCLATFPRDAEFSNISSAKIGEMTAVETINQRLVSQFKSQLDTNHTGAQVPVIVRNQYHQEKQRGTTVESVNSSRRHSDYRTTNFVEHAIDPANSSSWKVPSTGLNNEYVLYTAKCTENNAEVARNGDCRNISNSKTQSFSNKSNNYVTSSLQTHEQHFLDYLLSDNPKTDEKNTNNEVVASTQVLQGAPSAGLQYPVESFKYLQQNNPKSSQASNASNLLQEELRRVNPPSLYRKERVNIGVSPNVIRNVFHNDGIKGQLPNYDCKNTISNASPKTREQFEYHPMNLCTQKTYMDSFYKTIESSSLSIGCNPLNEQRSTRHIPHSTVQPRVQQASSYHPHHGRRYHGFNYESPNDSPYSKSTRNTSSQNQPNVATSPYGQQPNNYCTPTYGCNSYSSDPRTDINRIKPVSENNLVTGKNMVTHNMLPSNLTLQRHNIKSSSGITINNYNINTCIPHPNMPEHKDMTLNGDPYSYQHTTRPYNM